MYGVPALAAVLVVGFVVPYKDELIVEKPSTPDPFVVIT
jgi:hypothetical protein